LLWQQPKVTSIFQQEKLNTRDAAANDICSTPKKLNDFKTLKVQKNINKRINNSFFFIPRYLTIRPVRIQINKN